MPTAADTLRACLAAAEPDPRHLLAPGSAFETSYTGWIIQYPRDLDIEAAISGDVLAHAVTKDLGLQDLVSDSEHTSVRYCERPLTRLHGLRVLSARPGCVTKKEPFKFLDATEMRPRTHAPAVLVTFTPGSAYRTVGNCYRQLIQKAETQALTDTTLIVYNRTAEAHAFYRQIVEATRKIQTVAVARCQLKAVVK